MTPIERAARALYAARVKRQHPNPERFTWEAAPSLERKCLIIDARAVLQAIREPTEAMTAIGGQINAGLSSGRASQPYEDDARAVWQAMVDKILEESKEPMP